MKPLAAKMQTRSEFVRLASGRTDGIVKEYMREMSLGFEHPNVFKLIATSAYLQGVRDTIDALDNKEKPDET